MYKHAPDRLVRGRRATGFSPAALRRAAAWGGWCAALWLGVLGFPALSPSAESTPPEAEVSRYRELITTLASEAMEGRGPGTKGIELARDAIAGQFDKAGLKPPFRTAADKSPARLSYTQAFETRVGTKTKEAKLAIAGAGGQARDFQLDKDYTVMGFSAQKSIEGQAVWVGYGVKNEKKKYDSYAIGGKPAAKDALKGKIAICWRYEPMSAAGQSAWGEKGTWLAAQLNGKAAVAAAHGAAALLFVNPPTHDRDGLKSTISSAGPAVAIPVIQITPHVLKSLLAQAGRQADDAALKRMQQDADEGKTGLEPLEGVTLSLSVKLESHNAAIHNVAAVLPGAGALADQVVLTGAHYDHLGASGEGSQRRVYFGADDNASGTAAVVLLAERYGRLAKAAGGLPANRRSLVFAAFTGEERGLLGSRYLVNHLDEMGLKAERLAAMINLDMVGRMRDDQLMVGGIGSGDRWNALLDAAMEGSGLKVRRGQSGFGPSDHSSFYRAKIPVLFFNSGIHGELHSPRDSVEKINCEGAVKITNLVDAVLRRLWTDPAPIAYVPPKPGQDAAGGAARGGPYLGIVPNPPAEDAKGVAIGDVLPDGPAAKAGLKAGDVIVNLGGKPVSSLAELQGEISKRKAGDKVSVTVTRGDETVEMEVTLGKR